MLIGIFLTSLGLAGTVFMYKFISLDRYSYITPLSSHEITMLILLFIFFVIFLSGIITVIFTVIKKNNSDTLKRIQSMGQNGNISGICPNCGLNISKDTTECPRCKYSLNSKNNK